MADEQSTAIESDFYDTDQRSRESLKLDVVEIVTLYSALWLYAINATRNAFPAEIGSENSAVSSVVSSSLRPTTLDKTVLSRRVDGVN